ncbi:MAG: bifunctional lysylphosphatidylglycerol flippase/synthetase MprF [Pseudomonadota bacterium]
MNHKTLRWIGYFAVTSVISFVLWFLGRELHGIHYHEILTEIELLPRFQIVLAILFTGGSYLSLTFYDYFGLQYAGRPLPLRTTMPAAFVSSAFSNNVGLSFFGGMAFRYRLYSAFDLMALDIAKVVFFCSITFWLGILCLAGVAFAFLPPPLTQLGFPLGGFHAVGFLFLGVVVTYIWGCYRRGGVPIQMLRWSFSLPSGSLALIQVLISSIDWLFASAALYILLPASLDITFAQFVSIYLMATLIGVVSHVPGGVGVFETVFVWALGGKIPTSTILGTLMMFRAVYYLAPLCLAFSIFSAFEFGRHFGLLRRFTNTAQDWIATVVPRVFSLATFAAGVILLFSGVTPDVNERQKLLSRILPLAIVEVSHLFASVAGVSLLIIARGLQKRLDGAFAVSVVLLAFGATFSLLKGIDYEEGLILAGTLLLLLPCRRYFYRKASLFEARFSPEWIIAITATLGSMIWLMMFAHKHVDYSAELWWTFSFNGEAPRAIRASFVAVSAGLVVGIAYLIRAPKLKVIVGNSTIDEATRSIVRNADRTYGNLALLGDKKLLLNEANTALIMYATAGRSWIALGDPLGPPEECKELIWRFRELCDLHGAMPAFYQVDPDNLHLYVEAGLSLIKIGEEAIVDLQNFSLEGRSQKGLRNIMNRFLKEGYSFAVVPVEEVPALLPELERISSDWLESKHVKEKRFSMGFFSEEYLKNFPVGVVRKDGDILAFANLWETPKKTELSVDLMRYSRNAPQGVMDYLFSQLMMSGKSQGYKTFNLGMAPFSGMKQGPLAPLWSRVGAVIYGFGEHFYNFQGLREYKEKFHPTWRSKFLASQTGITTPVLLTNIASLISGGIKGVLLK